MFASDERCVSLSVSGCLERIRAYIPVPPEKCR